MTVYDLPTINACFNGAAAIMLVLGYVQIKRGDKEAHKKSMISAFLLSTIFLVCYLIYHYHAGSKKFPELGWIKTVYLGILLTHTILATVMVPMILKTFYHAFKGQWEKHKKIAVITFPIWTYVSVTGVIIYLMLYQFFNV